MCYVVATTSTLAAKNAPNVKFINSHTCFIYNANSILHSRKLVVDSDHDFDVSTILIIYRLFVYVGTGEEEEQAWKDIAKEINERVVFRNHGPGNPFSAARAKEIYMEYEEGRGVWFLGWKNMSADDDEVKAIREDYKL